jgi:hypothetical protein
MHPPTNNWREIRTDHRFYEEIIMDITTRNSERNRTTQKLN